MTGPYEEEEAEVDVNHPWVILAATIDPQPFPFLYRFDQTELTDEEGKTHPATCLSFGHPLGTASFTFDLEMFHTFITRAMQQFKAMETSENSGIQIADIPAMQAFLKQAGPHLNGGKQ